MPFDHVMPVSPLQRIYETDEKERTLRFVFYDDSGKAVVVMVDSLKRRSLAGAEVK